MLPRVEPDLVIGALAAHRRGIDADGPNGAQLARADLTIRTFQTAFVVDLIARMVVVGDALEPSREERSLKILFESFGERRASVVEVMRPFCEEEPLRRAIGSFLKAYAHYDPVSSSRSFGRGLLPVLEQ